MNCLLKKHFLLVTVRTVRTSFRPCITVSKKKMNLATVRRRERCGQHDRQFRGGTDPSVHARGLGPAAARILLTLSDLLALAHTDDKKSVCGTSSGGKLGNGHGLAIAESTQWLDTWMTLW